MTSDPRCPYCGGTGEVKGVVDDVEFIYQCSCSGGREESVRWLLGLNDEPPPGQDLPAEQPNPDLPSTNSRTAMMLKAPFRLPPGFLPAFGYRGGRRFVALFWHPCGDEACYDDGHSYACGLCDNWLFLDFVRRPDVRAWLDENGIHLGSSDETAQHWLVVDASTAEVFATQRHEARAILLRQRLSG